MNFKTWLENFEDLDYEKKLQWYKNPISNPLIAYHGGCKFDDFSLDFIGTGETKNKNINHALGYGIYFTDCKNIAYLYTKYCPNEKAIHKVQLNTKNFYDLRNGTPHLNEAVEKIKSEYKLYFIEKIFEKVGKNKAFEILKNNHIDGFFERLPIGCFEISVINTSVITKLDIEEII